MEHAVVAGEYVTFKHVKTRKVVVLEIEVPEEGFQEVITKLGMPVGGESKPVAVALLDKEALNQSDLTPKEQTEGEKLRTRAVLLCKSGEFPAFVNHSLPSSVGTPSESECAWFIRNACGIGSRSVLTTNLEAQAKFKQLLEQFESWKLEQQYKDNLERI